MIVEFPELLVPIVVGVARLERGLEELSEGLGALRAAASAQLLEFQNTARELGIDLPTDLPTEDVTA